MTNCDTAMRTSRAETLAKVSIVGKLHLSVRHYTLTFSIIVLLSLSVKSQVHLNSLFSHCVYSSRRVETTTVHRLLQNLRKNQVVFLEFIVLIGPLLHINRENLSVCVLKRIFELKRDANREWRRLHHEELDSFYRSPNIVRVIKSRRLRWTGHVARMKESRSTSKILTD